MASPSLVDCSCPQECLLTFPNSLSIQDIFGGSDDEHVLQFTIILYGHAVLTILMQVVVSFVVSSLDCQNIKVLMYHGEWLIQASSESQACTARNMNCFMCS